MTPEKTLKQATVAELLGELRSRCLYVAATIRSKSEASGMSFVDSDDGMTPEMLGHVTLMQHAIATASFVTDRHETRPNPRTN